MVIHHSSRRLFISNPENSIRQPGLSTLLRQKLLVQNWSAPAVISRSSGFQSGGWAYSSTTKTYVSCRYKTRVPEGLCNAEILQGYVSVSQFVQPMVALFHRHDTANRTLECRKRKSKYILLLSLTRTKQGQLHKKDIFVLGASRNHLLCKCSD